MRHSRGVADTLTAATAIWKTPAVQEPGVENRPLVNADGTPWTGGERCYDAETGHLVQTGLPQMVKATEALWKTPDVPNGGRAMPEGMTLTGRKLDGTKGQVGLENQAKLWKTPRTVAGEYTRDHGQKGAERLTLEGQAATNWPTPAARDHKGENSVDHLTNGTGRLHLDQLPNAVAFLFSHPDPETAPHGRPSFEQMRALHRLLAEGAYSSIQDIYRDHGRRRRAARRTIAIGKHGGPPRVFAGGRRSGRVIGPGGSVRQAIKLSY